MVYIMLNKPVGYVTSLKDDKGRRVVTDLIEGLRKGSISWKVGHRYIRFADSHQ